MKKLLFLLLITTTLLADTWYHVAVSNLARPFYRPEMFWNAVTCTNANAVPATLAAPFYDQTLAMNAVAVTNESGEWAMAVRIVDGITNSSGGGASQDLSFSNDYTRLTEFYTSNAYFEVVKQTTGDYALVSYVDSATNTLYQDTYIRDTNTLAESMLYTDDQVTNMYIVLTQFCESNHNTEIYLPFNTKIYWYGGDTTNWTTMNQTQEIKQINNKLYILE